MKPNPHTQRRVKKPLTDYVTLNHPGIEISAEEWEFIRAIEAYQQHYRVRYPTWREVLYVLKTLGYAKSPPVPEAETLEEAQYRAVRAALRN